MSKEKRQARRAKRQQRRAERRAKWSFLTTAITNAKNLNVDMDGDLPPYKEKFQEIWKVMEPLLQFAKAARITGPKVDAVLEEIITLGNGMANGDYSQESDFVSKLSGIWSKVRAALNLIALFPGEKDDEVIDKIIEIGDWVLGKDDDDEDDDA